VTPTSHSSKIRFYNGSGQYLPVSKELGQGGEGVVYELADHQDIIAKVYFNEKLGNKGSKIKTMIGLKTERLLSVSAWPIDTVHAEPGGPVVGLLAQKAIGYNDIHQLYSPKSRKKYFPSADWRFLIRTAANLAIACDVVHEHGHIIGDMNPKNIMVSSNALVKLIDCDSFQIDHDSLHYPCGVGVANFTPPELQNKDLTNINHSKNHDNFGLALLIFHLLFLGRHPFAGKYHGAGEMPIEKAIAEFRFAYGSKAASFEMEQPPNTLPLNGASKQIADLFESAFERQSADSNCRPTAQEWVRTLDSLLHNLTRCNVNTAHFYLNGLVSCPWCTIEEQTNNLMFYPKIPIFESTDGLNFDLDTIWNSISQIISPGPLPGLPPEQTLGIKASSGVTFYNIRRITIRILAIGLLTMGLVFSITSLNTNVFWSVLIWIAIIIGIWKMTEVGGTLRQKVNEAQQRLNSTLSRWKSEASDTDFVNKLKALHSIRDQYVQLSNTREKKIQELMNNRRQIQLQSYLDQFEIDRANIHGIGPGRKAMLASYGIETAADVIYNKIIAVPGFGPNLTNNIVTWRQGLEINFVFDSHRGPDPAEVAAVDREISTKKVQLQSSLMVGAESLKSIAEQIRYKRDLIWPEVMDAYRKSVQAKANLKAG
jgi:DNA-binding helix-hairpin-helix protein with protein kinase domain